ncbi:MAG: acyl-ACP--UDP-N-acetylglucosamine O-acyltransferase [Proteobacteria bacterium]|nr:acyl-ACP--UDP-N-acetylglucosamine O-acyltransferase [Pseudomonadota bacterium]NCA27816.1 acyl-ACP--UDP-N-acetylglucosamine O-acyltransferase [Pseudomonadota bacterium]
MIHPSAIINESAQIDKNVEIGPFCIIGEGVKINAGTILKSHVVIDGDTTIGKNNTIFPFTTIGVVPQDLKFRGEKSQLVIGDNNMIREHVTIHLGTQDGGMLTQIGSNNLLMVGVHIAHDCKVGNHVILANNATLAGHVEVGDHVVIGGLSAIHQFVRIGNYAMIGGMSGVESDVIPFGLVMGERASLAGLNLVGMKRNNISRDEIHALRNFYKLVFGEKISENFVERSSKIAQEFPNNSTVKEVVNFINSETSRSFCQPKN